jgi:hypothetical protein
LTNLTRAGFDATHLLLNRPRFSGG